MWKLVTRYQKSGVVASAWKSQGDPIEGHFAVGLFFSSYESRCLESSALLKPGSLEQSIVVFFNEAAEDKLRRQNDRILLQQVTRASCRELEVVDTFSVQDVDPVLCEVMKKLPTSSLKGNQKWFIDITGSPKPYYMALLAWLRDRIESPALTLFHAGGHYEKSQNQKTAFCFTEGFSKFIWVPYLWGQSDPRKPWMYFFLLGFEGNRSIEIYDRFEPEYVTALIGRPGYRPDYTDIAEEKNADFLREANPKKIYADAADAIETWKTLDAEIAAAREEANICIVPLGPKPHALGGCLASLTDRTPAVLYLMPQAYKVRDVPRGDYVWKYEVKL